MRSVSRRGLPSQPLTESRWSAATALRVPKNVVVIVTAVVALASGLGAAALGLSVRRGRGARDVGLAHRPEPNHRSLHGTVAVGSTARAPKINTEAGTHLTIVPTFESTVTSSPQASQIESAFNYAIGQYRG